jgi:hypothetical protein
MNTFLPVILPVVSQQQWMQAYQVKQQSLYAVTTISNVYCHSSCDSFVSMQALPDRYLLDLGRAVLEPAAVDLPENLAALVEIRCTP